MAKAGTVVIELDANTAKLIKGIKTSQKQLSTLQRHTLKAQKSLLNFAKAAAGLYVVKEAIDLATSSIESFLSTSSQFETYTNRMTAFTQSQEEANSEIQRATDFAREYKSSITDTTEAMLTLKNYGIDDSNESLKIFTNTAIGSGKSLSQYAEAVADALTGENERLKEFGVKASKIGEQIGYVWTDSAGKTRNILINNNKEIINSTLNAIMNEKYVGQIEKRAASWAGLMQNMNNNWVVFQKNVGDNGLFDYFKQLGSGITKILNESFSNGSLSAKQFADDTISFIQSIIKAVGFLAKALAGVANLARTVYAGFLKLDGFIGQDMNTKRADNSRDRLKELQRIQKEGDYGLFTNQTSSIVRNNIKKEKAELAGYTAELEKYTAVRKSGDDLVEKAAKSQANINKIIDGITSVSTKSTKAIVSAEVDISKQKEMATKALNAINAGYGGLSSSSTKAGKAQSKALKTAQKEAKKLQETLDATADSYASIFQQGFESILKGDFAGGLADILGDAMGSANSNLAGAFSGGIGNVLSGAGSFVDAFKSINPADLIGSAVSLVGGLLSNTLSEAEIKVAAGRTEFTSESLNNSISLLDGVVSEQTPIMQDSLRQLESLNDKFGSIAVAISSSSNGLDLDGSEFTNSQSTGFLGFSSSSSELIGAGINFGEQTISAFVKGVDAVGYEAIKKTSSSFFGLIQNESIKEIEKGLPDSLKQDLGQAFNDSISILLDSVDILGFDTDAIQAKLDSYVLDLGKLNFKDLDATEQAQALSNAFSEQLDGAFGDAINAVASPQNAQALDTMAKAGESYTETLVRAAVQHEYASNQLALFGQSVTDFATSDSLVQAAGGIDKFKSAMDTFVSNFFTDAEQQEMQKLQLEMALQTQNVALPASKAQFKALVLETQAKIINIKATISTLKAEIAAKVAGGELTIQAAYGELIAKTEMAKAQGEVTRGQIFANNQLIASSHESGKAVVGFGNSLNEAIKGIATGTAQAVIDGIQIDAGGIDFDAITSPAIQAAEAELSNLEGLYGALMDNMGTFADYYGGVESAAGAATDKLNELEKSLVAIANLKSVWGEDDISAKKIILDATKRYTGLTDLTYDNFLTKFEALTADGLGLDQETLSAWTDMSSALRAYNDVQATAIKKDIAFYENIIGQIEGAYTGSNSYLNSTEKSDYLAIRADYYKANDDNTNYIKALREQLASDKKMSTSREEYAVNFDRYIKELQSQEPEATTDDVVESIDNLKNELSDIKDLLQESNIQKATA
jgi:hypothetical protein